MEKIVNIITKQIVKYDPGYNPVFTFYRGGVQDIEKTNIFNEHKFISRVGYDKYDRHYWNSEDEFTKGFLFTTNDIDRAIEFFGFDKNSDKIQYKEVDLNLCFTNNETFILFKSSSSKPTPITKKFTKRTKTYKEFSRFDFFYGYSKDKPEELKYWKFKSKNDYIICNICSYHFINRIIPEIIFDGQEENYYHNIASPLKTTKEKSEYLYELGIIDLNQSWDYTQEYKDKVNQKRKEAEEKRIKRQIELERLKHTPGHCCRCGHEQANYVANPFDEEINGITNMQWLCHDCYSDICGDI